MGASFERVARPWLAKGSPTKAVVVLEMDGVMEAGDKDHDRLMEDIESVITFGKSKIAMDEVGGILYSGRRWYQSPKEFTIRHNMKDYIDNRLKTVPIAKAPRAVKDKPAGKPKAKAKANPKQAEAQETVNAEDRKSLYKPIPGAPKDIRVELLDSDGKVVEERHCTAAKTYRTLSDAKAHE